MVTEQHQYTSILTDEGGRMSDESRGGCRRNQNVGIAKGIWWLCCVSWSAIMTYDQRFVVGHMSLLTSSLLKATQ